MARNLMNGILSGFWRNNPSRARLFGDGASGDGGFGRPVPDVLPSLGNPPTGSASSLSGPAPTGTGSSPPVQPGTPASDVYSYQGPWSRTLSEADAYRLTHSPARSPVRPGPIRRFPFAFPGLFRGAGARFGDAFNFESPEGVDASGGIGLAQAGAVPPQSSGLSTVGNVKAFAPPAIGSPWQKRRGLYGPTDVKQAPMGGV